MCKLFATPKSTVKRIQYIISQIGDSWDNFAGYSYSFKFDCSTCNNPTVYFMLYFNKRGEYTMDYNGSEQLTMEEINAIRKQQTEKDTKAGLPWEPTGKDLEITESSDMAHA